MQLVSNLIAKRAVVAARGDKALVAEIDDLLSRLGHKEVPENRMMPLKHATDEIVVKRGRGRPPKMRVDDAIN